jgi:hypothetical protein
MTPDLSQLIEEWIPTSGLKSLTVDRVTFGFEDMQSPKAWLNYREYPINWYCNIFSDRIQLFYHNSQLEILAGDPEFFKKLSELVGHVIVSNDCSICKAEIVSNYTNYD